MQMPGHTEFMFVCCFGMALHGMWKLAFEILPSKFVHSHHQLVILSVAPKMVSWLFSVDYIIAASVQPEPLIVCHVSILSATLVV